jgi:hypothetical protein
VEPMQRLHVSFSFQCCLYCHFIQLHSTQIFFLKRAVDQGRRIPAKEERESERRRPGSWCVSGFGGTLCTIGGVRGGGCATRARTRAWQIYCVFLNLFVLF